MEHWKEYRPAPDRRNWSWSPPINPSMSLGETGPATAFTLELLMRVASALYFKQDVVFLVIGMPSLNGFELARARRAESALTQSVLVTLIGRGADQDRGESVAAGIDRYRTKPVLLIDIAAVIIKFS